MDSYHEFCDPNKSPINAGAKDLGSVHLRLGGFPVARLQNPSNTALSVQAPSKLSIEQTKGHLSNMADDRTDPFQAALKDTQKGIFPRWKSLGFKRCPSFIWLVQLKVLFVDMWSAT